MSYPIFEHPLVMEYDYYWRLEPHTRHFCDLTSAYEDGQWVERDPFRYMRGAWPFCPSKLRSSRVKADRLALLRDSRLQTMGKSTPGCSRFSSTRRRCEH